VSDPGDYKGMERGRGLNRYSVGSFCLRHGFRHGSVGHATRFCYVHHPIEPACDRPIGLMLLPPPLSTP
jgi:hypothetical protein